MMAPVDRAGMPVLMGAGCPCASEQAVDLGHFLGSLAIERKVIFFFVTTEAFQVVNPVQRLPVSITHQPERCISANGTPRKLLV